MLVRVSLPHTNDSFSIQGFIPQKVLDYVRGEYGKNIIVIDDNGEELINPFETEWYKSVKAKQTAGSNLKTFRTMQNMTQATLAEKLGTTRSVVSAMEHDARPISRRMAKKLSEIFNASPKHFL